MTTSAGAAAGPSRGVSTRTVLRFVLPLGVVRRHRERGPLSLRDQPETVLLRPPLRNLINLVRKIHLLLPSDQFAVVAYSHPDRSFLPHLSIYCPLTKERLQ